MHNFNPTQIPNNFYSETVRSCHHLIESCSHKFGTGLSSRLRGARITADELQTLVRRGFKIAVEQPVKEYRRRAVASLYIDRAVEELQSVANPSPGDVKFICAKWGVCAQSVRNRLNRVRHQEAA